MSNYKLYEYAVLMHPSKKEEEDGVEVQVVVPITTMVAINAEIVKKKAIIVASQVEEYHNCSLERFEVLVRPFANVGG